MKLTGILLLAAVIHVSARGTAQAVTFSAKAAPLTKVFAAFEKQTGYVFFYNKEYLQDATPVTVDLRQVQLQEALESILANEPLGFEIKGNTIVITRKAPVVGVNTNNELPPIDVHGHITDSTGAPLEGASVTVKGKKGRGTITNGKGEFDLKGVDDGATLIISFTGFEPQQIKVDGRNTISLQLKQGSTSLQDVVVNKGYYATTQRLNTGNVTTVSGVDINKQPVSDPILALEGRVPGLYIQQTSGVPGGYSQITIRGQNSIANGNDPLYIVDGVPFSSLTMTSPFIGGGAAGQPSGISNVTGTNGGAGYTSNGQGLSPLNNLNPADIESIEVLKDADATALYGSRGANGVILITTKKGKEGTTKFDLNVFSGGGKVTRFMQLLNTPQYLEMRHEALNNDGLDPDPTSDYDLTYWDTTRYTNWQKVLIGNAAKFTNIQANISGGNHTTQFILGGDYSKQGEVYPGNYSDQKASAHFSLTHTSENQRFHTQFTTSYTNDNNGLPQGDFTSEINLAPDAPAIHDAYGNINWQLLNGTATFPNPVAATLDQAKAVSDNLISNLNLSYQIIPSLQIKSSFGYNHAQMNQSILSFAAANPPPYNTRPNRRGISFATTDFQSWIIEPQLNFKKKFGQGQLEVLVGSTFQANVQKSISQRAYGFTSDALVEDPLAATTQQILGESNTLYHYAAAYGRVNYTWNDKYLLNLTARRDGSSRFGPGKQFGNFGAVGAGWIFSRERVIQDNLSFLSFGKLRASYGLTGNDQIADYQYLSTYSPNTSSYQGLSGLQPTQLTNPYFAWETVRKLEGAVELGFFKDRIMASLSHYRNRTGNQLVGYSLPTLTGFNSVQFNLPAVLQNTGTEMTLNTINIQTKAFAWKTTANLTVQNNKLVSFPRLDSFPSYANTYVVGQSIFIQRLYKYTGVNPQTGIYSFATKNANGMPSYPQDLHTTKPVTQKFYGGMGNTLSYKGFQFDVFIQFVKQLGYNYKDYFNSSGAGLFNSNEPTAVLTRWQSQGHLSDVQRFGTTSNTYNTFDTYLRQSDGIISDASFIRLKSLSVSYQVPTSGNRRAHLQNIRVYLQCENLFTVTRYLGLDPETGGLNLPPLRMVTAGIQISL